MMKRILACLFLLAGSAHAADLAPLHPQPDGVPWPTEAWPEVEPAPDVDADALEALLDFAFADPAPEDLPGTRAAIVIHRGRLVAERYADGFSPDRRFISQSMAKTVVGALVGILAGKGDLVLDEQAPVALWQGPEDPRRAITLNDMMQMSSGIDFNEAYFNPFTSDVLPMLFGEERGDVAASGADHDLVHPPGTHWSYSSGTTNVISGIIRDRVGGTREAYLAFMRGELFVPLGITSAVPEFDESGTFVGSSWLHMTARDWARFGLFMLRGGQWEERQILPKGWVDYMRTPLSHEPGGTYGAQLWLNAGPDGKPDERRIGNLPADAFMATGHRGQMLVMIPSKDLVILRTGNTGYLHYGDVYRWIGDVASAFPDLP